MSVVTTCSSSTVARQLAQEILVRVSRDGAFAERVLHSRLERTPLAERDRAFATELVYGTLRQLTFLDASLRPHMRKPLTQLPEPVLAALRLGAYQIMFTRVPARSAVNESVGLVRRYGRMTGVVNAVLRRLGESAGAQGHGELEARNGDNTLNDVATTPSDSAALSERFSHPQWLVEAMLEQRGSAATDAWLAANNDPAPVTLRVNSSRTNRASLMDRLQAAGIRCETPPTHTGDTLWVRRAGPVKAMPGFDEGLFSVQDSAATWVGHMLGVRPGDVVLDMCAAPGGKATHAAELMRDKGLVLAVDRHAAKTRLITDNASRLGLRCIEVAAADSRDVEALQALLQSHGHSHPTHIILDAPCSGMGTLRRNPELRQKAVVSESLVETQAALLDTAAALLPVGGRVVYAVCTVTAAEGPEQISAFLERHPDFSVVPPPAMLDFARDDDGIRTWTDVHGTDSFFATCLERTSEPAA